MTFGIPQCPECGKDPDGTIDTIQACAGVFKNDDGSFDYEGYTNIYWDSQFTDTDDEGHVTLICKEGHTWQSAMDD
jgi:hypothetical protein